MGDAGADGRAALNQSAVVIGGIFVAFILYLAVNDRLKVYLAMIGL